MNSPLELLQEMEPIAELYFHSGTDAEHRSIVVFKGGFVANSEYEALLSKYDQTVDGQIWSRLRKLGFEVAGSYLDLDDENLRSEMRDFVNESVELKRTFCQIGEEQCWRVSLEDTRFLHCLIAFVSLIDEFAGWGDTLFNLLSNIHFEASKSSVDYFDAAKNVAIISSDKSRYDGKHSSSVQEILLTFDPAEMS